MMANTVEDPNQDPNLYCEIDVSYCTTTTSIEGSLIEKEYKIYPHLYQVGVLLNLKILTIYNQN